MIVLNDSSFMVEDNPVKRLLLNEKGFETIVSDIEDDPLALEDFLILLKEQSSKIETSTLKQLHFNLNL